MLFDLKALEKDLRYVLLMNELSNEVELIYKFSDPDGVRTGKSGWSFGVCQFDVANNGMAALCLKECGFSVEEIGMLKQQAINIGPCNSRLKAHGAIVDAWDNKQLRDCINRVELCADAGGFEYVDDTALLMAADYHNQFFISKGGSFFTWAMSVKRSITADDIFNFKMHSTWGKKRPDDVNRRYRNVRDVMEKR